MLSHLTFEAIEGGQLESLTPGFFLLERFQQPLPLIQIRVSLQRVASGESAGIRTTAVPPPQTPLKDEAREPSPPPRPPAPGQPLTPDRTRVRTAPA